MESSKLLISEKPMMVLPSLATIIGLEEAIVLQQLHYWVTTHEEVDNERCYKHGVYWVYNTAEEWQKKQFKWWSIDTVRRVLQSLEKMGLIVSRKFESYKWNQRKWYTVNHAAVKKLDMITGETWQLKRGNREVHISRFVKNEIESFILRIGSNDQKSHLCNLPKSICANPQVDITENTTNIFLYSGASILNETTREEEENEASPVCTTGRSASCAVKGGEENGHTLVAPLSNRTKEAVFTPAQVEPVTITSNASLSEETVKRREVRRLKSVLKLLELPRNIQGYIKQCTIDQLTYVIETAIDKSDSFQGDALVRYTVGIFKNTLDPNPEARKPKHKRLTSKQLGRMSSAHYKHKDKYQDDPKRDESKIYPPIRIKVDGKMIECVLCGYQHDPEWGIETLSYHTYRESNGQVTRGYEYHSVEVPNVEIFRSVYPNGFVKGDW